MKPRSFAITILAVALFGLGVNSEARVRLVEGHDKDTPRSSSIGANLRDYIHIEIYGEIVEGDAVRLASLIPQVKNRTDSKYSIDLPRVTVYLDSDGGNVLEAMKIGRIIRKEMLSTVVDVNKACSSACVLLFASGVERDMLYGAKLGLHRPYFPQDLFAGLSYEDSQELYKRITADVAAYLDEMGATPDLIGRMLAISSKDVLFISRDEAQSYGIEGGFPAFNEWVRARQVRDYGEEITD